MDDLNRTAMAHFNDGRDHFRAGRRGLARNAFRAFLSLYKTSDLMQPPDAPPAEGKVDFDFAHEYLVKAIGEAALSGDTNSIAVARQLAAKHPNWVGLMLKLSSSMLDLCDFPAALEFARVFEQHRIEARRKAAGNGTLLVMFDEYIWSFGDLAFRPDLIQRLRKLGWIDWFPMVIDATPGHRNRQAANKPLLKLWEDQFPVVYDFDLLAFLISCADTVQQNIGEYVPLPGDRVVTNMYAYAETQTHALGPSLTLSPDLVQMGKKMLASMGVTGWYVCFHVRESASWGDEKNNEKSAKNADVDTYIPAMREVVARGGTAIRLGDTNMKKLPDEPGIVDYAHSPFKSPEMDVFLCATPQFMVCTCSGPSSVAKAFGIRLLITNAYPADFGALSPADLFIPKLIRNVKTKKIVPFADTFKPPFAELRRLDILKSRGFDLVDNTAADITAAVKEMVGFYDMTWGAQVRPLSRNPLRPEGYVGMMSPAFVLKHRDLL